MSSTGSAEEDSHLISVIEDVHHFMEFRKLSLLANDDDNADVLSNLLLIGISGGKESDIRDPNLLFQLLKSNGNRQVCQYQFKRYTFVVCHSFFCLFTHFFNAYFLIFTDVGRFICILFYI